jgi:hypothetical protein
MSMSRLTRSAERKSDPTLPSPPSLETAAAKLSRRRARPHTCQYDWHIDAKEIAQPRPEHRFDPQSIENIRSNHARSATPKRNEVRSQHGCARGKAQPSISSWNASQHDAVADVADGSFRSISRSPRQVRCSPDNRHGARKSARQKSADNGLTQRSKICPYSITSSAIAISVGGTSRPRDFAVLRLSTKSNLVDCITGKSAGFCPLRICPA